MLTIFLPAWTGWAVGAWVAITWLWAWALCRAAARGDEMIRSLRQDLAGAEPALTPQRAEAPATSAATGFWEGEVHGFFENDFNEFVEHNFDEFADDGFDATLERFVTKSDCRFRVPLGGGENDDGARRDRRPAVPTPGTDGSHASRG